MAVVVQKRRVGVLPEAESTHPTAVMHAEEIIPFRERPGLSFFFAGFEDFASVEQQATPAVWRGVRENPKHSRRLAGIAFGVVQLQVWVDFECVQAAQPFRIVNEGENRVTVARRVEERADTAKRLDDVGIKAHVDLLPAGARRFFGAGTHGEEGAGGTESLAPAVEIFAEADARRGATLRVGNFKS